jgi:DNA polymerase-3 subunit delta'
MQFSDIQGLDDIKRSLIHAAREGHIAHAQLFLGPEGSANLAMALAFCAYLNGDDPQPDGSLTPGPATEKLRKFIHPDVHFVFPVGAAKGKSGKDVVSDSFLKEWRGFMTEHPYGNLTDWSFSFGAENKQLNISKEESRNIIRKLSLKSFEGRYKVVILWMPELLHPAAANGILKILEEPPERTLFLLVAHDAEKLLPTILSRTQIVNIPAFSDQDVAAYLARTEGVSDPQDKRMERYRQIATLADGNMRTALHLLSEVEEDNHQVFRDWMRLCYTQQYDKLLALVERIHKMGKEAQKGLMQYGLSMMRESLMMLAADELPPDDAQLLSHEKQLIRTQGEELKFITNFSRVMNFQKIEALCKMLNEGYYHLERNASPKMVFLDISLRAGHILKS